LRPSVFLQLSRDDQDTKLVPRQMQAKVIRSVVRSTALYGEEDVSRRREVQDIAQRFWIELEALK
jgi:hypothetical protein